MHSETIIKSFKPAVILGILAVAAAFYAAYLLVAWRPGNTHVGSILVLGVLALSLAYWAAAIASLHIDETGIHFWRGSGWRHWVWSDVTAAHLSGTGTVPGIAIYHGREAVRITRTDYPALSALAQFIQSNLSPAVVVSTWQGD